MECILPDLYCQKLLGMQDGVIKEDNFESSSLTRFIDSYYAHHE